MYGEGHLVCGSRGLFDFGEATEIFFFRIGVVVVFVKVWKGKRGKLAMVCADKTVRQDAGQDGGACNATSIYPSICTVVEKGDRGGGQDHDLRSHLPQPSSPLSSIVTSSSLDPADMKSSSESISAAEVVVTGVGGAGSVEASVLFFALGGVSASTALRFLEVGMVAAMIQSGAEGGGGGL